MGSATTKIYSSCVSLLFVATIIFASLVATSTAATSSIDLSTAILITVDQSGEGDFKKIKDAFPFWEERINHCPKENVTRREHWIHFLGLQDYRCWQGSAWKAWGAYSRVVYAFTYMSGVIQPQGWDDWHDYAKQSNVYYGEYKCYGPGANRSNRVAWSQSLSEDEVATFLNKDTIGGSAWLRRPAPSKFKRGSTSIYVKADRN